MQQQYTEQLTFNFQTEQAEILDDNRDELRLKIGEFAGPLDLLLFLIRQEQANIFDIPVARITDEYLKYIRLMKVLDIVMAGDFLVMAATLIEIKSKMLLPREPAEIAEEEFEDPRRELVDRLLEHQKYKNAAEMLWTKSMVEQSIFVRGPLETDDNNTETNASVFDLLTVFQKILSRHKEVVQMEIAREEISLAQMIEMMKQQLSLEKTLNLREFFQQIGSKRELVTAFIAVLEIVRSTTVKLTQRTVFGEIWLKAT
jgi:segregation and condensation protein A